MKKIKKRQMKMWQAWMKKTMVSGKRTSRISKRMLKVALLLITPILKKAIKICKGESKGLQEGLELTIITICKAQATHTLTLNLLIISMLLDQQAVVFK